MTPENLAAKLKFRSTLSRTLRDGVTAPCGKSAEHELVVKCAKAQVEKEEPDGMCLTCADALRNRGGGKGRKKGAKRGR